MELEKDSLLVESWGFPVEVIDYSSQQNQQNQSTLTEAKNPNGNLYIQGIFMQADVINGNKRLYPKRILEKAVDRYTQEQIVTKQALGELNHPPRPNVDPKEACIIIEKLWWEGNNVMGRARVVTGDNGTGDKIAALIRAGWVPGVSSRGLGRVIQKNGYNEVQEGFRLTVGVDIVWGPSAPNAFVKPVFESKDDNKQVQPEQLDQNKSSQVISEDSKTSQAAQAIKLFEKFNKKNKDAETVTSLIKSIQKLNNK